MQSSCKLHSASAPVLFLAFASKTARSLATMSDSAAGRFGGPLTATGPSVRTWVQSRTPAAAEQTGWRTQSRGTSPIPDPWWHAVPAALTWMVLSILDRLSVGRDRRHMKSSPVTDCLVAERHERAEMTLRELRTSHHF